MDAIMQERMMKKVDEIVALFADGFSFSDVWKTIVTAMEFAQEFDAADFKGPQKKELAKEVLNRVLDKTDSPGPDLIVDWMIREGFDLAFDYLASAAKGKFAID